MEEIKENDVKINMDVLYVLSRMCCSTNEASITCNEFIFRKNPSFNLIVVEHVDESPLSGKLRIVMTSDPRGLSLAFGMINLAYKLPTDKNTVDMDDFEITADFLRNVRNPHMLSR
jgi:hypothetical protein